MRVNDARGIFFATRSHLVGSNLCGSILFPGRGQHFAQYISIELNRKGWFDEADFVITVLCDIFDCV